MVIFIEKPVLYRKGEYVRMKKAKRLPPPRTSLVNEIFYLYSNHEDQLEKIIDIYSSEHAHRAMSLFMEKAGWKEK